jgi:hypothetical protein
VTATIEFGCLVRFASRTLRRIDGPKAAIGTDRSDMLTITAPAAAGVANLTRQVGAHYPAITRWVRQGSAVDAWVPPAKELVAGEGFELGAHSHRLRWDGAHGPGATFVNEHGRWLYVHPDLRDDAAAARQAIIKRYGQHTREKLRAAAELFGPRFGFRKPLDVRSTDTDRPAWIAMRSGKSMLTVEAHWALAQFSTGSIQYLTARTFAARPGARSRLDVVMPCPWQPRRRFHEEAPNVWEGAL